MQFVQISDLHLGRSFGGLHLPNDVREVLVRAGLDALDRACELVTERDAAALLIPGDLFDRPEVDEGLVGQVQALLGRLQRPVLVSPGNHDAYGPMSVWNSAALRRLGLDPWPENVHIFASRALTPHSLLDGELIVYGHRVEGYHSVSDSPLADAVMEGEARFRVLLIHGALEGARYGTRTTVPFTAQQLSEIGADYAAVGHYHRHIPIEYEGRLLGAYAGVAVPGEIDEDPHGGLLVVTLQDTGPDVEFVDVHPGRIARLCVRGEPAFDSDDDARARTLTSAAERGLGRDDVVVIRLTGCSSQTLDTETIAEALGSDFRHAVVGDDTEPDATAQEAATNARVTVESQFIHSLQEQIERCGDPARRTVLESALKYGRLALRGRAVRPPPVIGETDEVQGSNAD